jgi:ATP-dependent Clp protease ATP-binding subunit ClpC
MGISVELTKQAKEFLADKGFDPQYGARPLRRALQRFLEDPIAEEILKGKYPEKTKIKVKLNKKKGELRFSATTPEVKGDVKEEEKPAGVS